MSNLRFDVARRCQEWRRSKGIKQGVIASDLQIAQSAVSAFESGANFSGRILLWYITHGLDLSTYQKKEAQKMAKILTLKQLDELSSEARAKLTKKELSPMLSEAAKRLNKRLDRLAKDPDASKYALEKVMDTGGRFGVNGKSRNEMQKELSRMLDFYRSKTSTIAGARAERRRQEKALFGRTREQARKAGEVFTAEEANEKIKAAWKAYRKFEESHPDIIGKESGTYIRNIGQAMSRGDVSEEQILARAEEEYEQEYLEGEDEDELLIPWTENEEDYS